MRVSRNLYAFTDKLEAEIFDCRLYGTVFLVVCVDNDFHLFFKDKLIVGIFRIERNVEN